MIQKITRVVYYAPTRGRSFFTLHAAARAEAKARIRKKYPTEEYESDTGYSFHAEDIPRYNVMYRRLYRLIMSDYKKGDKS